MALYRTPEEHAANPPETWEVRKVAERRWHVVDRQGSVVAYSIPTKREAEETRLNGPAAKLWHREARWYAGETPHGWKPWEQVKAERERHAAWLASKAVS